MTHVCLDQPEGHLEQDGGGGEEEQLENGDKLCQHDGGEGEEEGDPGAHNYDGEREVDLEDIDEVDIDDVCDVDGDGDDDDGDGDLLDGDGDDGDGDLLDGDDDDGDGDLLEQGADTFPIDDQAGTFPSYRLGKPGHCFA